MPPAELVAGHVMVPDGFDFAGRPQLVARFRGTRRRAHAPAQRPRRRRRRRAARGLDAAIPSTPTVRDGAVWGRGACDMKGGVGVHGARRARCWPDLGVALAGDLAREHRHGGGVDRRRAASSAARTLHADGAIVPEPSGLVGVDRLPRLAAAGDPRRGPRRATPASRRGTTPTGGAVNAIEKASYLIEAVRRLREEWSLLPRHPYLSPPDCVPTMIQGGEWLVSYPARCRIDCHIEFLPDAGRRARLGLARAGGVRGLDRARRRGRPVAARAPSARRVARRRGAAGGGRGGRPAGHDAARRASTPSAARRRSAGSTTGTTARR